MEWQDEGYLAGTDLNADECNPSLNGVSTRRLLVRRNVSDQSVACFTTRCPAGSTTEILIVVEGHPWAIEDSLETAKTKLGLDHNGPSGKRPIDRSWHGWHRHVSLVMLAFAMLAGIRHHANQPVAWQTLIRPGQSRHRRSSSWSVQETRRIVPTRLPQNAFI